MRKWGWACACVGVNSGGAGSAKEVNWYRGDERSLKSSFESPLLCCVTLTGPSLLFCSPFFIRSGDDWAQTSSKIVSCSDKLFCPSQVFGMGWRLWGAQESVCRLGAPALFPNACCMPPGLPEMGSEDRLERMPKRIGKRHQVSCSF